jgi:two-component sensor histidine kinase
MARSAKFQLAADKLAVREARLRVRDFGDLPRQTVADAELVVSELVANSLVHARLGSSAAVDLTLSRDDEHLTIEVDDHGSFSGRPRSRRGMGLRVLDALCVDWRALDGRVTARIAIAPHRPARRAGEPAPATGERGRRRLWPDRRSR